MRMENRERIFRFMERVPNRRSIMDSGNAIPSSQSTIALFERRSIPRRKYLIGNEDIASLKGK